MRRGSLIVVALVANALAGCASSSGESTASGSSGSSSGNNLPSTATLEVGAAGGTVEISGVTFTVPAGALSQATNITITRTTEGIPTGYAAYSPIIRCSPNGLTFSTPATMTMDFDGPQTATMFWTDGAETSFNALATTILNGRATANVGHFSAGFVGDFCECDTNPVCDAECSCDPQCSASSSSAASVSTASVSAASTSASSTSGGFCECDYEPACDPGCVCDPECA